jgi:uncharacterized protein with von Willebrand factor type A (vWA) domain
LRAEGDRALANIVGFVRYLRHNGVGVSPSTAALLVRATGLVGLHSRRDVKAAFHALVVTDHTHEAVFDEGFERFFTGDVLYLLDDVVERAAGPDEATYVPRVGAAPSAAGDDAEEVVEVDEVTGSSTIERLMDIDFSDLTADEAEAVASILASMQWQPSSVRSRRWKASATGHRPDMRRTLRTLTSAEADLMPLRYVERRVRQRPLIVIADVSGSMERYTQMLLHFLHGAQHRFGRVETFVFSTSLTRITRELQRRDPSDALKRVADSVHDWSGGTRIGDALETYNRWWSRRVSRGGPIGLIISDGWDTGEPAHLGAQMDIFARSVHSVVWLNPLSGRPGFAPEARGMAASLPYVDELLSAATIRNLADVVDLLDTSVDAHRRSAIR